MTGVSKTDCNAPDREFPSTRPAVTPASLRISSAISAPVVSCAFSGSRKPMDSSVSPFCHSVLSPRRSRRAALIFSCVPSRPCVLPSASLFLSSSSPVTFSHPRSAPAAAMAIMPEPVSARPTPCTAFACCAAVKLPFFAESSILMKSAAETSRPAGEYSIARAPRFEGTCANGRTISPAPISPICALLSAFRTPIAASDRTVLS